MRFRILQVSRVELNNLLTQEIVARTLKALFILRPHKEALNHEQIKCGVHSEKSKPFSPAPPSPGQPASPALSSAAPAGPDVFSPTPDSLAQSFPSSYPQMSLQGDKEDIYKVGYDRWFENYLIETARTVLDERKKLENRADYTSTVYSLVRTNHLVISSPGCSPFPPPSPPGRFSGPTERCRCAHAFHTQGRTATDQIFQPLSFKISNAAQNNNRVLHL